MDQRGRTLSGEPRSYSGKPSNNCVPMILLPNMRLKLAAPVLNESRGTFSVGCARIPFVNLLIRRRSLSAIR